jgi:hypothetical protein
VDDQQWKAIRPAIVRLRATFLAVAFGTLAGVGLFVATAWLVLKGGPNVGQHLSLLGNYYPGYSVSWGGAILGFVYGAATGGAIGYVVAWVYNTVVLKRLDRRG